MVDFIVSASDLRSFSFFQELTVDELRRAASALSPVRFAPDERIFREGEASDTCYILVEGSVELILRLPNDVGYSLAVLGRGDIFGEMCLLADQRRSATAVSRAETLAWRLHRHVFDAALEGGQLWAFKLGIGLGRILANRLATMNRELIGWLSQDQARPAPGHETPAAPAPSPPAVAEMDELRHHLLNMLRR